MNLIAVFLGGGIGASLRYLCSRIFIYFFGVSYPATLFVNILGCFLIGFLVGLFANKVSLSESACVFIITGLLGGLTTFSTCSLEAVNFLKEGKYLHFSIYTVLSVGVGFIATYIGLSLNK